MQSDKLETETVASEHHGDNETEGIKPIGFDIQAVDEDAAECSQVGIAASEPKQGLQFTKITYIFSQGSALKMRQNMMT